MSQDGATFTCEACQRKYHWKAERAGRKVKCGCGHVMTVAVQLSIQTPAQTPEEDLYDIADAPAVPARPMVAVAREPAPGAVVPLAYRSAPTAREIERASGLSLAHIDMTRDIYVPSAMMLIGAILYIGYYAIDNHLGMLGISLVSFGLGVMAILETAALVTFALVLAGPMGVSFGGLGTAILKLAAIVLFCDGFVACIDGVFTEWAGGATNSFLGFGAIGFPLALGIYWVSLIYLFGMDATESWMIVLLLAVFYQIVRIAITFLLLQLVLGLGHRNVAAIPMPAPIAPAAGGNGASAPPPPAAGQNPPPAPFPTFASTQPMSDLMEDMVNDLKSRDMLREARAFAAAGNLAVDKPEIDGWYSAGCKNVWYEMILDPSGKLDAGRIIIELPKDGVGRAKSMSMAKLWYINHTMADDADYVMDLGQSYLIVKAHR